MSGSGGSLRHGREMVAIPGPSIIPERVLEAMARPMPDLYEGELLTVGADVRARLPAVAGTGGEAFVVIANGHGAWQMATSNTLARGDRVLVCESGLFATVWGDQTSLSGVEVETLAGDFRAPVDPDALEARLRADTDHEIAAVLTVHVDTASSVRNDIAAMRAAIDRADHPALFMVDCIASMACERFEMDEWGVDVAVAASQKGLMVPPGIAFVWANDRALAAHERADMRVGYLDWEKRRVREPQYLYFGGTPPIPHLYGLRVALDLIDEEGGLVAVWRRHEVLADAVRAAVEAWATPDGIEFNVVDPGHRSNCVTTVRTGSIDAVELRRRCREGAGLVIGLGIGGGGGFRIGHMGHLNPPMVLGGLGTVEAALRSMNAPLGGSGVAAAAEVIGNELATPNELASRSDVLASDRLASSPGRGEAPT